LTATRVVVRPVDHGHGAHPALVALVVTYNRLHQLKPTVLRLLDEDVDHVVVVDNASTDGTGAWLSTLNDPRLSVITSPQNVGGAGGFQLGMAEVTGRHDPDWCVVMDDDARPEPGIMARFRAEMAGFIGNGWHAISAGVYYPDGAICEMNRPSRNPFWHFSRFVRTALGGGRKSFHVQDQEYYTTEVKQIDATSFVGLFLSRQGMALGGLPDGRLFLYGDDVIYTLSLSRKGGRIGFAPWLRFEHDCSTYDRDSTDFSRIHRPLWKAYYNYRNGLMAYRIVAGPVMFWPVLAIIFPKWFLKYRHYGPDAPTYRRILWLAVGDALSGRCDRPHAEIVARSTRAEGSA
jgi:rhamnopyranosyl-N-acetylglucosaminyl-diphospho-decaprenol beta-1,3/1,4-galactofuranosyltransferase